MTRLVPQSWGSALREFNQCHAPADGKFCSTSGPRHPGEGLSATEWATRKSELWGSKPRSIAKLYGTNGPTPLQHAEWMQQMKVWGRAYRRASKLQKVALAYENARWQLKEANDCHSPAGTPVGGQFCSKGGVRRVRKAEWQSFTAQDRPDFFYYHVTTTRVAKQIIHEGELRQGPGMMGRGGNTRGVFVTERAGVPFWAARAEEHAFDLFDNPPGVAVIRIRKALVDVDPDPAGSRDARAPAYTLRRRR